MEVDWICVVTVGLLLGVWSCAVTLLNKEVYAHIAMKEADNFVKRMRKDLWMEYQREVRGMVRYAASVRKKKYKFVRQHTRLPKRIERRTIATDSTQTTALLEPPLSPLTLCSAASPPLLPSDESLDGFILINGNDL
eukprot:TRINITY_DN2896_c1_g1_i1.p2 TRINITY_DN2896_c1_g1~~TRINITY_DN2896_c1_g1_i1.p2  ORF type:complete len:137 (+),score=19.59 TRINITY_DN2896_c1_g1_i1:106-516(+)